MKNSRFHLTNPHQETTYYGNINKDNKCSYIYQVNKNLKVIYNSG